MGGAGEPGEIVNPAVLDAPAMEEAFADFDGMAATLRFDDGAIELETAGGFGDCRRPRSTAPTGATT